MKNFDHIQQKLHDFIRKYYTNEIIKGSILFLAFGLLYFIFTLFVEYFLWLKPLYRTLLFWLFILVELILLTGFILIPLARLFGFRKGITPKQASQIIGKHFKEVDDKLLNILQLSEEKIKSELLLAGIEQKSAAIEPIPFKNAINFRSNIKFIKYLAFPLLIWMLIYLTGNNSVLTQSLERVVHHNVAYQPPAPFYFQLDETKLKAIEGKPFDLNVHVTGDILPQYVQIHFNDETYFLKKTGPNAFSYHFEHVNKPLDFNLKANDIESKNFHLALVPTPNILDFEMKIEYPSYIYKKPKTIKNTGNITVPAGSKITWNLKTKSTDEVVYKDQQQEKSFKKLNSDKFALSETILQSTAYRISSSNKALKEYEKLNYRIEVIKDEFPEIRVKTDIDSITRGNAHFVCLLNDDYAIRKLQLVYKETGSHFINKINIPVTKASFAEIFYSFPDTLNLEAGRSYELYFQVFDNDAVSGSKSSKSRTFIYNQKTLQQKTEEILKEQNKTFNKIDETEKQQQKLNNDLKEFNKKLKNKKNINWNEKNNLDNFLDRQKKYQQMLEKNRNKLIENLDELPVDQGNKTLQEKKEALKKRLEELKEIEKNDKLLQELEKLSEKLKKDGLIDKLDKLTEKNKQQNRSLERILEMVKQFYTEMKANEIAKKLDSLAKEQENLSKDPKNNTPQKQQELNRKFDSIQKDFKELNKQNKELKSPIKFPDTKKDREIIKNEMKNAEEKLNDNDNNKTKASQSQKNAARQMKELSKKIQNSLQSIEGEMITENIKDLQNILSNLLKFSFDQEALMLNLKDVDASHSEFPKRLKEQQNLKVYFEHIDDSLYALSFRLVKLSSKIQTDLTNAHYNLDKSLEHLSEDEIEPARTNQHYTMTAANNLADLLSDILESLKNPKMSMGKGKGKKGQSISLPDIIKKQRSINQQMKEGLKKGKKPGQSKEQMSGELYKIYKEQSQLKQQLQELLKQSGGNKSQGQKAVKQMQELEQLLLQKGFTEQTIKKMQQLDYELLKLEKAIFEQGKDTKRQSKTGKNIPSGQKIKSIKNEKLFFNPDEILIRKSIPMQPFYQKKVNNYFKSNAS
ncbi:MAG: hypothetical protein DSY82_09670 [Flavobacteriia bacterium]|nr:MAG: hypothetical protein DSY82_09670 [Flavobacteriia bacterium]